MNLLHVEGLSLRAGTRALVENISFSVAGGETLAIMGASGAGKTLTALSILRLLPPGIFLTAGSIRILGKDVMAASAAQLQTLRGSTAGMVFQEPHASLNPLLRVGSQIEEALRLHGNSSKAERRLRVQQLLAEMGLRGATRIANSFPHHLSGGERQRIMIAMALANNPRLLIADEPATALDRLQGRQILDLIAAEKSARGLGVVLVTHDFEVARHYADRVLVLSAGRVRPGGTVGETFAPPWRRPTPRPYPCSTATSVAAKEVLRVEGLSVKFPIFRGFLKREAGAVTAVDGVSFSLAAGETLGVVGESGAGKSSLALSLARLIAFDGKVTLAGEDFGRLRNPALRAARRHLQIVFQDPFGSLPPRMAAGDIIAEGLKIHAHDVAPAIRSSKVMQALREVELPADAAARYPHEFSGGQRQRIAIARSLILQPRVLVLDEPTSALDTAVQAEIIQLLHRLQEQHGIAYIVISHDLAVMRAMAHRVIVLQHGRVVETGSMAAVFSDPQAEYTKALVAAEKF